MVSINEADRALKETGHNLSIVEEMEPEPSLGMTGLETGFLASIAALGLLGDAVNASVAAPSQVWSGYLEVEIQCQISPGL